jgi:hypothetical protein
VFKLGCLQKKDRVYWWVWSLMVLSWSWLLSSMVFWHISPLEWIKSVSYDHLVISSFIFIWTRSLESTCIWFRVNLIACLHLVSICTSWDDLVYRSCWYGGWWRGGEWCQKTCWSVVDEVNDRPIGNPKRRFDEYSSKFSLSYETKVVNPVGKSQYSRRWCLLA